MHTKRKGHISFSTYQKKSSEIQQAWQFYSNKITKILLCITLPCINSAARKCNRPFSSQHTNCILPFHPNNEIPLDMLSWKESFDWKNNQLNSFLHSTGTINPDFSLDQSWSASQGGSEKREKVLFYWHQRREPRKESLHSYNKSR